MKVRIEKGWILVAPDEDNTGKIIPGSYYICWHDLFGTRISALTFARKNNWHSRYRAIRGQIMRRQGP